MSEYIEREAVLAGVEKRLKNPAIIGWLTSIIADIPAADVVPLVHGRWIDTREFCGDYMCSNCDALYGTNKFNYCPNCGARMDGDKDGR